MNRALLHQGVSSCVLSAAIDVHRELGPGLIESVYEVCLARELIDRDCQVRRQVPLPVLYKGEAVECGFRADMIIDDCVLVELKAIETILPIHEAQLMTYLRISNIRVGLLINFNELRLKDGILRRVI